MEISFDEYKNAFEQIAERRKKIYQEYDNLLAERRDEQERLDNRRDEIRSYTTRYANVHHPLISSHRDDFESAPYNLYFDGSEAHHVDERHVVYIPRKMHHSVRHSLKTGEGMNEINKLAFDYLFNSL